MTPHLPPARSSDALWLKREADLVEALCIATYQMRDLANGWSINSLFEAPALTMERLTHLVPHHEVRPL